jgi:hypothetical protein
MGKTGGKAQPTPPLTVALDTSSARMLADAQRLDLVGLYEAPPLLPERTPA